VHVTGSGPAPEVSTGQDEPSLVDSHGVPKPFRVRLGADQHEQCCGREPLAPPARDILHSHRVQVTFAVAVDNPGVQPHFNVPGRHQLRDKVVGHAACQRVPSDEHRNRARPGPVPRVEDDTIS
jgi:hypothetical protein